MSDGEAQRAMRDAIEDGLNNPCGCNKYRRHHCGIVDPNDAKREAEKKAAAERLLVCCFPNCIRPRASGARACDADDSDRLCVYCRREKNGLPRFPVGDPEGCNLVADRKRAEAALLSSGSAEYRQLRQIALCAEKAAAAHLAEYRGEVTSLQVSLAMSGLRVALMALPSVLGGCDYDDEVSASDAEKGSQE